MLWSETNLATKNALQADFELRDWNDISVTEKENIWLYLDSFLFNSTIQKEYNMIGRLEKQYYEFYGPLLEKELKQKSVLLSIITLNEKYKVKSYANSYLKNNSHNAACFDFYDIFLKQDKDVVFELLSIYIKFIYDSNPDLFNKLRERINDIFLQFSIKYYLSSNGFIDRQDDRIITDIYEPTLSCLTDKKWQSVNDILSDAFTEYGKNNPQGYSNCVTNGVSAIQAFLQILIDGKTGSSEGISFLIKKAQDGGLIPNDKFTKEIFKNIDAVLMRERGNTGIAHPKQEYANEKNARLVLNLVMIFIQHCIQR